jgi:hypothetical protein
MKTKESAMKLSQIRRRIELCLREIILRFEMNLQNLFFLDNSIHIRILNKYHTDSLQYNSKTEYISRSRKR